MAGQREKHSFFSVCSHMRRYAISFLLAVMVNVSVSKILSSGIEEDSNDLPDRYEGIKPVRIHRESEGNLPVATQHHVFVNVVLRKLPRFVVQTSLLAQFHHFLRALFLKFILEICILSTFLHTTL